MQCNFCSHLYDSRPRPSGLSKRTKSMRVLTFFNHRSVAAAIARRESVVSWPLNPLRQINFRATRSVRRKYPRKKIGTHKIARRAPPGDLNYIRGSPRQATNVAVGFYDTGGSSAYEGRSHLPVYYSLVTVALQFTTRARVTAFSSARSSAAEAPRACSGSPRSPTHG